MPASRKGTEWLQVLQTLVCYRLIDPGSEWRWHRYWFAHGAMADRLGEDFKIAQKDTLYRGHDHLLEPKEALFKHLKERWETLFGTRCEVLLYDLTSTCFESDPPFTGQRQFGYRRDQRPDCVQVVIALVVTPEGFPLGDEVRAGNPADNPTLRAFLEKIERMDGKADRVWLMDRGIPTEALLAEMRRAAPPVHYLVGTPKGRLRRHEEKLAARPGEKVRDEVSVKLLEDGGEI